MLHILWLMFALFGIPQAHAEEAAAPSGFDAVDAAFGKYLVGPMASVMFFDLAFWDNTLPVGEIPTNPVVGDEEITGHSAQGYAYQKRLSVERAGVTPVLSGERTHQMGPWELKLTAAGGGFVAMLPASPVGADVCADPETCGVPLTSWAEQRRDGEALVLSTGTGEVRYRAAGPEERMRVVGDQGPFPLLVVGGPMGVRQLAAPVAVAAADIALSVGDAVTVDGAAGTVQAMEDDEVTVRLDAVRHDTASLSNPGDLSVPLVVAWLVLGAVFFTLRMAFINLRGFAHAVVVTTGAYDNPDDPGEISHFKALSSALSATVGLGNIAGVAIAVAVGGPGAIPWMIIAGFLGMSSKFTECTLGQMYRTVDEKGHVSGGPMRYLDAGLAEMGMPGLGKVLAIVFALMCIGGSLGGGNMFQANQSYAAVAEVVPLFAEYDWAYGLILAVCVGMVILGGIKRIGAAAGMIVPLMCGIYVLAGLYILIIHADKVGGAFGIMLSGAFSPEAGFGGVLGALIQGFRRAAFSNEAGIGSASIAHSAAATDEPVREGIVALLEPFIDTIIVCTMTGLVVVITGAYEQNTGDGVLMTSAAFGSVLSWFPLVLSFAVVMFAFSTMISWSYYGERCATYLFGQAASLPYKIVFLICVVLGSVFKLGNVLDFSDLMVLGMAFPNILGVVLLSGKVKVKLDDYMGRLNSGEMKRTA